MNARPISGRIPRGVPGYTTIELLIASFISLFVVIAAGTVVFTNQRSFKQGGNKLAMQGEASRSVEQIERDVRHARWVDYGSVSDITLYDQAGDLIHRYYLAGSGLDARVMQDNQPLVDDTCTLLHFEINPDTTTVVIQLQLQDPAQNKVRVDSKASIRNRPFTQATP